MSLKENYARMGLQQDPRRPDSFRYEDRYGEVLYRQVKTFDTPAGVDAHQTDNDLLEHYAVYSRQPAGEKFFLGGIVSRIYRFEGHDRINNLIRESIQATGKPLIHEMSWFPESVVVMRTEFVISSEVTTPEVGDIYPTLFSFNTYNGTGAQGVSYGISIKEEDKFKSFALNLGSIKSIHTFGAKTRVQSTTSSFLEVFSQNISDVIRASFTTPLTEDITLKTLDFIETVGKKKRIEVSQFLEDIMKRNDSGVKRTATAWEMFMAILKCSSVTGNINTKRLLESAAERVLVMPDRMLEALKHL